MRWTDPKSRWIRATLSGCPAPAEPRGNCTLLLSASWDHLWKWKRNILILCFLYLRLAWDIFHNPNHSCHMVGIVYREMQWWRLPVGVVIIGVDVIGFFTSSFFLLLFFLAKMVMKRMMMMLNTLRTTVATTDNGHSCSAGPDTRNSKTLLLDLGKTTKTQTTREKEYQPTRFLWAVNGNIPTRNISKCISLGHNMLTPLRKIKLPSEFSSHRTVSEAEKHDNKLRRSG